MEILQQNMTPHYNIFPTNKKHKEQQRNKARTAFGELFRQLMPEYGSKWTNH
jgi:hypothetical protein